MAKMSKTGQHVDATADCLWPRRLSRSKQLPLGTDFFKLLDNIGIPQSADGKEQEPSVRDGVSEDDAYSIQTFGRLIADIISNASELILSEIRKPARLGINKFCYDVYEGRCARKGDDARIKTKCSYMRGQRTSSL
jgi:hypothetical protein